MRGSLLIFFLLFWCSLYSQTGPNNSAVSGTNTSIGSISWNNSSNIFSGDDLRSDAPLNNNGDATYYLTATDFGFNLPSSDIIDGIVVEIERSDNSGGGFIKDNSVKIIQGGTISGTEQANGNNWPNSDAYKTYGSTTDLWGLTWTAAEINANNFGVAISVKRIVPGGDNGARIDHIRITVYHHPDPMPIELLSFNGIQFNKTIKLSWTTATEINNDYFLIEKTLDGFNFEEVGKVEGSGNSSTQHSYFIYDEQPVTGINYYRLTQVDFDGQRESFQIIAIDFCANGLHVIKRVTIEGKNFYPEYTGIYLEFYSDGSYRKKIKIQE